jgi:hypothetical protein
MRFSPEPISLPPLSYNVAKLFETGKSLDERGNIYILNKMMRHGKFGKVVGTLTQAWIY